MVFAAMLAGHQVGDYWMQTDEQAADKGMAGWSGRRACLAHVASYTACVVSVLGTVVLAFGLPLTLRGVVVGQVVSAVTHYFADRRVPLRRLALAVEPGKREFWDRRGGAALLDQAWHVFWLFVSAVVTVGVSRWTGVWV